MPKEWLELTTHRLDIYNEALAKTEFIDQFDKLYQNKVSVTTALSQLPTAYDYIRLGHPLSSVMEWAIARSNDLSPENVISFSSRSMPILAILRKNLLEGKDSRVNYSGDLPDFFNEEILKHVYGYQFELKRIENTEDITEFAGSNIYLTQKDDLSHFVKTSNIDFIVNLHKDLGSVIIISGENNNSYISSIQHVRRRESIAMTPADCKLALELFVKNPSNKIDQENTNSNKLLALSLIKEITHTDTNALIGSSGLSVQYAIMMGLVDHALERFPGKQIKIIVPPNCYGGTNDQARRVAACSNQVEVMDLPVDGNNNMVRSTDLVLEKVAKQDAIPLIIAEIPTNPRVEVPDLDLLKSVLTKVRKTSNGDRAIEPIFILDQTFCPNVNFLGQDQVLAAVQTIAYVSGSKFPSGGRCTAGYCVANEKGEALLFNIEKHLKLCDNEATDLQINILAEQMPSMLDRIENAYQNTREFVNFITETLPEAKINFVSEELAVEGFTPSVFSLDLPTKGDTEEERENYKRKMNHELIKLMISEIPNESKYCVSYGQLKGCYWTIPATSTQGTTKEGDKDYIVRVALSGKMNMEHHKKVFSEFIRRIKS